MYHNMLQFCRNCGQAWKRVSIKSSLNLISREDLIYHDTSFVLFIVVDYFFLSGIFKV